MSVLQFPKGGKSEVVASTDLTEVKTLLRADGSGEILFLRAYEEGQPHRVILSVRIPSEGAPLEEVRALIAREVEVQHGL